jgi:hypothetical protein
MMDTDCDQARIARGQPHPSPPPSDCRLSTNEPTNGKSNVTEGSVVAPGTRQKVSALQQYRQLYVVQQTRRARQLHACT